MKQQLNVFAMPLLIKITPPCKLLTSAYLAIIENNVLLCYIYILCIGITLFVRFVLYKLYLKKIFITAGSNLAVLQVFAKVTWSCYSPAQIFWLCRSSNIFLFSVIILWYYCDYFCFLVLPFTWCPSRSGTQPLCYLS